MSTATPAAIAPAAQAWMNPAITRTGWGEGEWNGEPDKVQWRDPLTHLPCLAVRHFELGHWCGYVGVHAGHALHGAGDIYELPYLEVHGSVNFTSACQPGPIEASVCHVPAPGEADDVWWLGFDCAHAWDYSPGLAAMLRTLPGLRAPRERLPGPGQLPVRRDVYRTLVYVRAQCGRLAAQVAGVREVTRG